MDDLSPWHWGYLERCIIDPKIAGDAFRWYRDTLAIAITPGDILRLANSLYSKNVISQDNLERAMMTGILPSEKKVHLLDAIEARIRSNPRDFRAVLDILNSEPVFSEHAKVIWEKYQQVELEQIAELNKALLEQNARLKKTVQEQRAQPKKAVEECIEQLEKVEQEWLARYEKLDDDFAEDEDAEESAKKDDEKDHVQESADSPKSKLGKKTSLLSRMRKGVRKMFGAARDMTSSFIKEALSALNLDVKIFRRYKKRFDKHTNREQVRWWFEIWGDEGALKALDSKWEGVSSQNKWRLETCPVPPPQRC